MVKRVRTLLILLPALLALLVPTGCAPQPTTIAPPRADLTPTVMRNANGQPPATPTPRPTRTPIPTPMASPSPTPWPTRPPRPTATPWLSPSPTPTSPQPSPTAVVAATRPAALAGKLALAAAPGGPIYIIGADGRGLRQLTTGLDPAWSPDGARLAVARLEGEQRGLWIVHADSGEELLFGWSQLRWPAWSPDGKTIVFARQYGGKEPRTVCFPPFGCFTLPGTVNWRLGAVDVAARTFRDVPSDMQARLPAVRADASVVYVGEQGLQTTTLTGNDLRILREENRVSSPALSPDGARIVYMSWLHDHYDLFLVNADGANPTRLTRTSALEPRQAHHVAPAWSPDGSAIAFLSDRAGKWQLYIMNADGSNQRPFLTQALAGVELRYEFADERAIAWGK